MEILRCTQGYTGGIRQTIGNTSDDASDGPIVGDEPVPSPQFTFDSTGPTHDRDLQLRR